MARDDRSRSSRASCCSRATGSAARKMGDPLRAVPRARRGRRPLLGRGAARRVPHSCSELALRRSSGSLLERDADTSFEGLTSLEPPALRYGPAPRTSRAAHAQPVGGRHRRCNPRRRAGRRPARGHRPRRAGPARAGARPRGPGRLARAGARRRGARVERGPRASRRDARTSSRSSTSRRRASTTRRAPGVPLHVLERIVAIPYALDDGDRCASRSPTRRTSTRSTSCGSRRATRSSSPSRRATTSSAEIRRLARASEAFGARAAVEEELDVAQRGGGVATTSRSTTASPTRRSSGSSTRSSSRPPRTAPPTSTSSRRRTRSSSASASTACSRRCSGSRSG